MNTISLERLSLRNFKGATNVELDLRGNSAAVHGRNATGKTTLADAYSWLLFEKDSQGRKDFDIKTLSADGRVQHGLEHEVEGVFLVDGKSLVLKRTYKEKWTKKRGSPTAEFTGHETAHEVDGVPVTKGEYARRVSSIADEATWRLLSDPTAFAGLHWQDRRKVLLEVVGDVTDEEVIDSNPELAELPSLLDGRELEDHRKVVLASRKKTNEALEAIPVRIDEATRGMPEKPEVGAVEAAKRLAEGRLELAAAQERLAAAKAGTRDGLTERRAVAAAEAASAAFREGIERRVRLARSEAESVVQKAQLELAGARERLAGREPRATEHQAEVERLEGRLATLRAEWAEVNARVIDAHVDGVCPACKQALPEDQVAAAHARAIEELNAAKARDLERIKEDGDDLKRRKEAAAAQADLAASAAEGLRRTITELTEAVDRAQAELNDLVIPDHTPEELDMIAALEADCDTAKAALDAVLKDEPVDTTEVEEEIHRARAAVESLERAANAWQAREQGEKRITELRADEKRLATEFQELERQLNLLDEFTRSKVKLLESKVASAFTLVSFRLFKDQINGGITEACDITVGGVPFESVNHAGQIAAGLDIIRTLQAHHGLSAPIWIDQAESIHDIPATGAQQVALIVSPTDQALRVELDARKEQAA